MNAFTSTLIQGCFWPNPMAARMTAMATACLDGTEQNARTGAHASIYTRTGWTLEHQDTGSMVVEGAATVTGWTPTWMPITLTKRLTSTFMGEADFLSPEARPAMVPIMVWSAVLMGLARACRGWVRGREASHEATVGTSHTYPTHGNGMPPLSMVSGLGWHVVCLCARVLMLVRHVWVWVRVWVRVCAWMGSGCVGRNPHRVTTPMASPLMTSEELKPMLWACTTLEVSSGSTRMVTGLFSPVRDDIST
jgi:hypothetical protein